MCGYSVTYFLRGQCSLFQINRRYVLTAAHCHTDRNPIVTVRLGEHDLARDPDCNERGCKSSENLLQIISCHYFSWSATKSLTYFFFATEKEKNRFGLLSVISLLRKHLSVRNDHITLTVNKYKDICETLTFSFKEKLPFVLSFMSFLTAACCPRKSFYTHTYHPLKTATVFCTASQKIKVIVQKKGAQKTN